MVKVIVQDIVTNASKKIGSFFWAYWYSSSAFLLFFCTFCLEVIKIMFIFANGKYGAASLRGTFFRLLLI